MLRSSEICYQKSVSIFNSRLYVDNNFVGASTNYLKGWLEILFSLLKLYLFIVGTVLLVPITARFEVSTLC